MRIHRRKLIVSILKAFLGPGFLFLACLAAGLTCWHAVLWFRFSWFRFWLIVDILQLLLLLDQGCQLLRGENDRDGLIHRSLCFTNKQKQTLFFYYFLFHELRLFRWTSPANTRLVLVLIQVKQHVGPSPAACRTACIVACCTASSAAVVTAS